MRVLVTGSAGLVGSSVVRFYCERDAAVIGIDNNFRSVLFGKGASTSETAEALQSSYSNYAHRAVDIRDQAALDNIFHEAPFDLIVHAAAQPSHEWASQDPLTDFSINATATLQLLECTRQYSPSAVFVFISTNKVYGDHPNALPLRESVLRWDLPTDHRFFHGIDETMSIDHCTHSLFGSSKVAADILVQEYAHYYGIQTCILRCGCLTGGSHAGTLLHGFLSHLVRSVVHGEPYSIIGYEGKQVRDNLHADDLASAIECIRVHPRPGRTYNMGGGRLRSLSVLEALDRVRTVTGKIPVRGPVIHEPRKGDHLWYISSTAAFERDHPSWHPQQTVDDMIEDIARQAMRTPRAHSGRSVAVGVSL